MLKRSLFAVTLAASTLLVTGTARASGPSVYASAQHVALTSTVASDCLWRAGCYKCYNPRTGSWEIQHCDGGSNG
jgi:hypothetical protein